MSENLTPRKITNKDTWANENNPTAQRISRKDLMLARNIVLINHLFASKEEDKLSEFEIEEIKIWFDALRDMPDTNDISCLTNIPEKIKKHI
jgi:hypothetical protein